MTIDEIEIEIRKLSDADKMLLFERFNLVSPIIKNSTTIEIDDMSMEREKSPRAILHYPDDSVRAIDILESVKKNSSSIGHPAILIAIRRWEQLVQLNKMFFEDAYDEKYPLIKEYNQTQARLNHRIATYLKNIGTALYKGAKKRDLSKEPAFKLYADYWGLYKQNTYLYKAWELLGKDEFRDIRNSEIKSTELCKQLGKEKVNNVKISINKVMDFFSSTGKRYFDERFPWEETRNAFLAWNFNLDQDTIKNYYYRGGKKESNGEKIDKRLFPGNFPIKYNFSEIGDSFLLPTVLVGINDNEQEISVD